MTEPTTAGLCAWCSTTPPLDNRIVCSEACGEAHKQWAIACEVVNGCTRDGQCVLPNGHATGCDWGGDDS